MVSQEELWMEHNQQLFINMPVTLYKKPQIAIFYCLPSSEDIAWSSNDLYSIEGTQCQWSGLGTGG